MNRRDFLKTMGVGAGAVLGAEMGSDVLKALAAPDPSAAGAQAADPIWHVLNRITFGPRPGQVEAVKSMGIEAYIEQQLAYTKIDDSDSEKRLGNYATLDMTVTELLALGKLERQAIQELDSATVLRAIYSPRQLFEVMAGFWSEHFSIWHYKEQDKYLKSADDRDVVRKYALGKFRDILGASAKSPAMLIYLDNAQSNKKHPNENYAREVMELHTITIGNYTEQDVKEVARCFTGWTIQGRNGDNPGTFMFNPKLHDDGEKTVLGQKIPAGGGIKDGEMVLNLLAAHPKTAELIANKLARRFIADTPPDNVVAAAAQAFLKSGGDIPTVLRVIFAAPEFLNAPPKYKRPFEYLISLFRALDVQIDDLKPGVLGVLDSMGHLPFNHITPDGYSDFAINWQGNMLLRWNAAINTVYNKMPGVKVDLNALARNQNLNIEPNAVVNYFAQLLYGRPMTKTESDALLGFMNNGGTPNLTTDAGRKRVNDTLALMFAAPAFQYR